MGFLHSVESVAEKLFNEAVSLAPASQQYVDLFTKTNYEPDHVSELMKGLGVFELLVERFGPGLVSLIPSATPGSALIKLLVGEAVTLLIARDHSVTTTQAHVAANRAYLNTKAAGTAS